MLLLAQLFLRKGPSEEAIFILDASWIFHVFIYFLFMNDFLPGCFFVFVFNLQHSRHTIAIYI